MSSWIVAATSYRQSGTASAQPAPDRVVGSALQSALQYLFSLILLFTIIGVCCSRPAGRNATSPVVSIFVNPTQFGPNEDLNTYPRDSQRDEKLCRDAGVAIVFALAVQDVYSAQFETFVEPGELAKPLCGAFGPDVFVRARRCASCSIWCSQMSRSSGKRIFSSARSSQPSDRNRYCARRSHNPGGAGAGDHESRRLIDGAGP